MLVQLAEDKKYTGQRIVEAFAEMSPFQVFRTGKCTKWIPQIFIGGLHYKLPVVQLVEKSVGVKIKPHHFERFFLCFGEKKWRTYGSPALFTIKPLVLTETYAEIEIEITLPNGSLLRNLSMPWVGAEIRPAFEKMLDTVSKRLTAEG